MAVHAQDVFCFETQFTASDGENSPLWLNANKHGLSSLTSSNGYVRGGLFRSIEADTTHTLSWGYGADVAVASRFTSTFVVQQAYAEAQWKIIRATLGSKEQPMELKNQELSSGSQTFGINARPVPQLRIGFPDYVDVPFTKGWLGIKGYCAYGMTTDDDWQRDFAQSEAHRTENTFFHAKAAYLRLGRGKVNLEFGMEAGCQFGGKSYQPNGIVIKNKSGLRSFINALYGGGTDITDGEYKNKEGNHVGSWNMRLNIDQPAWNLGLYCDQLFEDNSMMVHIAYNGWGEKETAHQHEKSRYFIYDFKDAMLGAELKLKQLPWLNDIVLEFLATKYQGGPTYHDITYHLGEHITGRDDYYNHSVFTGWQHWGQVMGNPLFLSPIYNTDGTIEVKDNRFTAWHLGLAGDPIGGLHYRLLASVQKGFGTYYHLYPDPRRNFSLLAEGTYRFSERSQLKGWHLTCGIGLDRGRLLGDNIGFQLTVGHSGLLKR